MRFISVTDRNENRYPFSRELFEDRNVIYHGTWSTYCSRIESEGLLSGNETLDHRSLQDISEALKAVADGSFLSGIMRDGSTFSLSNREVYFTPNFWGARSYATDGGGELARMTIKDALSFEDICNVPATRLEQIAYWEKGLLDEPDHAPTKAAVALLQDDVRMQELGAQVTAARLKLQSPLPGGYPVVYAVRVDPSWFGDQWQTYLYDWQMVEVCNGELRCRGIEIPPDRLVGRADYPRGTDSDFIPCDIVTWDQAEK